MKLVKRANKRLMALAIAVMMATVPQISMAQEVVAAVKQNNEVRLQDDFYAAINNEWLKGTTIPEGYPCVNAGLEVQLKTQAQLSEIFSEIFKNEANYKSTDTEKKMINLYKSYLDKDARNKQGIAPIKPYIDEIKAIKNLSDIDAYLSDSVKANMVSLCPLSVSADLKNSDKYAFYSYATSLLLDNSDYYNKPSEQGKIIEEATMAYIQNVLILAGYSKEEADQKVKDAFAFEKLIATNIIGQEEVNNTKNIYEKLYNVYTLDQLEKLAPHLKLNEKVKAVTNDKVKKVVVTEPKWLEAFDKIYTEDHVEMMKNYMEIKFYCATVSTLSDDFVNLAKVFTQTISGAEGSIPEEQQALQTVNNVFSDEIGKIYAEKYFSKQAKDDVTELVEEIIAAYKKKLEKTEWMSPETKAVAMKKLDNIKIKVGYPDKWTDYSEVDFKSYEEGGSLFDNIMALTKLSNKKALEHLDAKTDKESFPMPVQMVEACYGPTRNDITFPAAILQSPYYDSSRSKEANLGGIGVVIAHEISHAFDTNGANIDENGNVNNWWKASDKEEFDQRAQKVKDFYNNITLESGAKVNGDLTVSENVADIEGMACALDILREMDNPDYKAFFEAWATSWRMINTPEYEKMSLESNVHSPHKVRVNAVVSQFQEFYDTYGIKEGDGMYVKPEDRISIY